MTGVMLRVASDTEIELMKEKVATLAEQRGIKIDHPELLAYVKKAGANVDERQDGAYVRFSRKLQAELLEQIGRKLVQAGKDPAFDIAIPHPQGLFYTRPVMGCMHITTETGEERLVGIKDVAEYAQLVDELDNINMYCSLTYALGDLPPTTTDINCLYQNLNNGTKKHAFIQPYEAPNARYCIEMGAVAAGGLEKLQSRPIISSFTAITEPFRLIHMDCETLVRYAELGLPIGCGSIPTSGANAPITPAGTVLLGVAQVILIALLTQCVHPGLGIRLSVQPLMMDMKSTYTLQSNPGSHVARMLASQVLREGDKMAHQTTGGGTDSFRPGPESVANVCMTTLNSALAGATILTNHGMCQTFKRFSPLQLIVDNEIVGMVKAMKKGCTVDEESLDFEEILNIGETESFVGKDHNLRHFREVYRARIFNTVTKEQWEAAGAKDLFDKARDVYSDFKKKFRPRSLPEDVRREKEKIVVRANEDLAGARINLASFV